MSSIAAARGHMMNNYGVPEVTFVRGLGTRLWDQDGKEYLDFLCGLAVTSLGHCHPRVVAATAAAAGRLEHVSNLFATVPQEELADRLDRLIGGGGKVFFCNSGAEANECAIKLARKAGGYGRYATVSAYNSFHGRTLATLHATGQPTKHEAFQPLPEGFRHVAYGDLPALEHALDASCSAVLLETIQGEGGVVPLAEGKLAEIKRICQERDVLLILDEVQTGLGRTGKWWGFQHHGVAPDIVTVAKALGNGFPIGACWARADVADAFVPGDHGSTFGGQPLAASVALAVLQVMEEEDLPSAAARQGQRLAAGLAQLAGVESVRGQGLLLAALLEEPVAAAAGALAMEAGLVVNPIGSRVLRLAPPLNVSDGDVDRAVEILAQAINQAKDSA